MAHGYIFREILENNLIRGFYYHILSPSHNIRIFRIVISQNFLILVINSEKIRKTDSIDMILNTL